MSTSDSSGTTPIALRHVIDSEPLAAYIRAEVTDFVGPLTVKQFKGGQSNPTFLVRAGQKNFVLRSKPPGELLPSAHAVDREYRVITALAATGVPVARTYALCQDETVMMRPASAATRAAKTRSANT